MSRYRNRIEIIADILNIVKDGARKTQIMYKGNLSYKLLTCYLREVVGAGLVCRGETAEMYQLTEKGETFLRHFENYARNRVEVEEQLNNIKSLKVALEDMCMLRRLARGKSSEHNLDFLKKPNKDTSK